MPTINVNPLTLIAGTVGIPIATNALGRTFITPKEPILNQNEANAELRKMMRNFAIFNGLVAAGLGLATAKADLDSNWKSVALGGAISTGLVAALLGGALVTGPSPAEEARQPPRFPVGGGVTQAPTLSWVSNLIGYPR